MAPVTLEEFFRYLVAEKERVKRFNSHWLPVSMSTCSFCTANYQFIIKLENVGEELDYFLKKTVKKGKIHEFPQFNMPSGSFKRSEKLQYLKEIPPELILQVVSIYKDDYEMFGYKMPMTIEDIQQLLHSDQ